MKKLAKETEIFEEFGIPLSFLRADRIRDRKIPFIKVGRSVYYDRQKVTDALTAMGVGGIAK